MTDKTTLRRALLAHRQAISAEVRHEWNAAICARVLLWWERHRAAAVGVYLPIRGEPDLGPAYEELSARGVRLALPVVDERDAPLRFLAWRPGDALAADLLGMQAPACATEVRPDALLIPCVGFNAGNVRLGYGGGFYDRTLAQLPRPAAIGIAYAAALADFAAAPHDVPLDRVITERSPTDA